MLWFDSISAVFSVPLTQRKHQQTDLQRHSTRNWVMPNFGDYVLSFATLFLKLFAVKGRMMRELNTEYGYTSEHPRRAS